MGVKGTQWYLFTLAFLLTALGTWQTATGATAEASAHEGAMAEGGGASAEDDLPLSFPFTDYDEESDLLAVKRHLGSIAAYSGYRNRAPSDDSDNTDLANNKRHLGSIAASAGFRPLRTQTGGGDNTMEKRHLGSVAAYSGSRARAPDNTDRDNVLDKRHLGSIAAYSGSRNRAPVQDHVDKRHLGSIAAYSGPRSNFMASPLRFNNDDNIYKFKRFLASLWDVGPNGRSGSSGYQPNKRHIGSVARLGWLPYKANREDYQF